MYERNEEEESDKDIVTVNSQGDKESSHVGRNIVLQIHYADLTPSELGSNSLQQLNLSYLLVISLFKIFLHYLIKSILRIRKDTMCPRSSDPFYIVSYKIKWVTTSWTHSIFSYY